MKLFENNNPDLNEKGIHPMDQILEEFSLENSGRDIHLIRNHSPRVKNNIAVFCIGVCGFQTM